MAEAAPIDTGKLSFPFKDVDTSKIAGTSEAWEEILGYLVQVERRMRLLQTCPGGCRETAIARTKIQETMQWIRESRIIETKEKSDGT